MQLWGHIMRPWVARCRRGTTYRPLPFLSPSNFQQWSANDATDDCLVVSLFLWLFNSVRKNIDTWLRNCLDLYIVFVRFNITGLVRQLSYRGLAFCSCYMFWLTNYWIILMVMWGTGKSKMHGNSRCRIFFFKATTLLKPSVFGRSIRVGFGNTSTFWIICAPCTQLASDARSKLASSIKSFLSLHCIQIIKANCSISIGTSLGASTEN